MRKNSNLMENAMSDENGKKPEILGSVTAKWGKFRYKLELTKEGPKKPPKREPETAALG